MTKNFQNGKGSQKEKTQEQEAGQKLTILEWLVVGLAVGFVLTAVAVAMYIHGFCR
ncbi:MAG: hypothetical protein KF898_02605 [Parachlamydiales bacterium]|nr:hypothetical protein [Verrucomicrobiota bacterium]MBX3718523.1 hypothetical protein [Candidatus Acheromyda pituitae]